MCVGVLCVCGLWLLLFLRSNCMYIHVVSCCVCLWFVVVVVMAVFFFVFWFVLFGLRCVF